MERGAQHVTRSILKENKSIENLSTKTGNLSTRAPFLGTLNLSKIYRLFCGNYRHQNPESVKETIARGVDAGLIAYVGKSPDGGYDPFYFDCGLSTEDIEISDDVFIITGEEARKHIEPPKLTSIVISPENVVVEPGKKQTFLAKGFDQHNREFPVKEIGWGCTGGDIDKDGVLSAAEDEGNFIVKASVGETTGTATYAIAKPGEVPADTGRVPKLEEISRLSWVGEVPPQKWMNFYTKVLSKFSAAESLKIMLDVEISPKDGISKQKVEETKIALRELGLNDDVKTS